MVVAVEALVTVVLVAPVVLEVVVVQEHQVIHLVVLPEMERPPVTPDLIMRSHQMVDGEIMVLTVVETIQTSPVEVEVVESALVVLLDKIILLVLEVMVVRVVTIT